MRALVTGCAGFIGSHVTETLLAEGADVVGLDCFNDNYGREQKLRNLAHARSWDAFEFVPIDLAAGELHGLVEGCDLVVHLAAEPGVRASWGERFGHYLRNNIQATQHLLEALRASPATRLVYTSSSSVYGQSVQASTSEAAATHPLSPYGVTKLAAESLCRLYHETYGVDAVSLRLFSVYGPRQRPDMACHIFGNALLTRTPVRIFGDGSQTRDFTFVSDVVAAIRSAGAAPGAGGRAYNIGSGVPTRLSTVLDLLAAMADVQPQIAYRAAVAGDVSATNADTSRARAELGYEPATALATGLAAQWEWLCEQRRHGGTTWLP